MVMVPGAIPGFGNRIELGPVSAFKELIVVGGGREGAGDER